MNPTPPVADIMLNSSSTVEVARYYKCLHVNETAILGTAEQCQVITSAATTSPHTTVS